MILNKLSSKEKRLSFNSHNILLALLTIFFLCSLVQVDSVARDNRSHCDNPRIYWTWGVDNMEKDGLYPIAVDYVTSKNKESCLRDGAKNDLIVPEECVGKNVIVRLVPASGVFKIRGSFEHTLHPSYDDYSTSWDVQPQEAGKRKKITFEYSFADSPIGWKADCCYINVIGY
ncbi:Uncharacterised protein [uncultured archaeon]|nr:Uncharacterised protein [uncultured archaeon]